MPPANEAAWGLEPKGVLKISTAPYNVPSQDEIVIHVCIIYIRSTYQISLGWIG